MNAIILLTAMSAGQPPGGVGLPPLPQPARAPFASAQPPMTLPMQQPMPMTGMPPMNGNGDKKEEEKKDEEKKDEKKDEPPAPEPYALMRLLSATRAGSWLTDNGIKIDGWIEGNYTTSTSKRNNLPVTFADRGDFWQFNQNYFRVAKEVDASKEEFQLGFRTDWILPGTDARFTIARGLWDGQLKPAGRLGANPNYYPIDLYQGYLEAFLPNLGPKGTSVQIGRFATHCEYEVVQGAVTPFLQRSYLFQYNPFTHSGVSATTRLNDTWTVANGLAVGSDNFFGDPTNRLTYLGQVKWAPKDGKTSVLFNVVLNDNNYQLRQAFPQYNVYNMQITHNFTDKLTYVLDTAFSHMDNAPRPDGTIGSATWYGVVQYLFYKHTDKVTSNFRVELFEDTKGVRTGSKGLYTEVTYGVAYSPVRSLIIRPSVRYDYNNNTRPFEGRSDQFTASMDVILRY